MTTRTDGIHTTKKGLKVLYRIGTSDNEVIQHSFENDIFALSVPEFFEDPHDGCIVDIGAHIGTFSLNLSMKCTNKIIAIEASKETFYYLKENIASNQIDNIIPLNLAVSSKNGLIDLYHDSDGNWGHSITKKLSTSFEKVQSKTLKQIFEENNVETCSLAKFNCEGAEFEIINQMDSSTLKKCRKLIILYHQDLIVSSSTPKSLLYKLRKNGFYAIIKNESMNGKRGWIIAEQLSTWRLLARYLNLLFDKIQKIGN